jgi:phosphohistidine phosphatase
MHLYIIRHAPAVPGSETLLDAARPLTDEGAERWQRAARGLDKLELRFEHLYHSPWLRAVQTASALHGLVDGETHVTELLACAPSPKLLSALKGEHVAVVGHEPWLSELTAWLVTGNPEHARGFSFKKGSVAVLEGTLKPGQMALASLLPPKVLRQAAKG